MKYLEFQSNKEAIFLSLIGVIIVFGFVVLVLFCRQWMSYDYLYGKLIEVVNTKEEHSLVVEDVDYKLEINDEYDIQLFTEYIGDNLNFYVNINYGKNSRIYSIDLIEAQKRGCTIPYENPYYYYKWVSFYILTLLCFVIYMILWWYLRTKVTRRMQQIYSDRSSAYSLINRRLVCNRRMYENGMNCYERKTYCTFNRIVNDYIIEYTFVFHDRDTIAGLLKRHYQVCFFLETLKIKSKKTGIDIIDLSDKFKDRILDLSDKYKENELDSNLFHPEDVLPFANKILDEIDEQIRLQLPDTKI